MRKRLLSLCMVLLLLIGMFPVSALAAEQDDVESAAEETELVAESVQDDAEPGAEPETETEAELAMTAIETDDEPELNELETTEEESEQVFTPHTDDVEKPDKEGDESLADKVPVSEGDSTGESTQDVPYPIGEGEEPDVPDTNEPTSTAPDEGIANLSEIVASGSCGSNLTWTLDESVSVELGI